MKTLFKKLKKFETILIIGLFCMTYVLTSTQIGITQTNSSEENTDSGIEPEVYTKEDDKGAQDESRQSISSSKTISQLLSDAKAAIKKNQFDEAERIVDEMLIIDPSNLKALGLKDRIKRLRHLDNISGLNSINEKERKKNIEILDEKIIPYTENMRFPEGEDLKRVQERVIPDKTEQFEGMKDKTSKMRLVTKPETKTPKDIEDALNTIISFEFYDVSLRDVIAFLREKTNINLITAKDLPETTVILKLNNVTIRTALKYILPEGVSYDVKDDIVYISNEKLELRVYDIRDLLINLDDRVGGTGGEEGGGVGGESRNANQRVQELMRLITAMIEPLSWNPERGRITTREDRSGDLIIVNTDRVHKQIEDILTSMRSTQHLQVSIEARFIQMTDNFLEDIGVELQNVSISAGKNTNNPDQQSHEIDLNVDTSAGAAGSAVSQGLDLTYSILKDFQLDLLLKAVQESNEAEILTSPRITLSNTQRGSIRVVNEISYVSSYEIISQVPQPVIAVVQDGTTFDVRPIISTDRTHVFLEVHPNITVVAFEDLPFNVAVPFTSGNETTFQTLQLTIEQPLVNRQELSVTVDVPDRGTLMIGGLGTTQKKKRAGGVPVLSKIPFIKRLFSRDSEVIERTNLIIILKPTIIIRDEEMESQKVKS